MATPSTPLFSFSKRGLPGLLLLALGLLASFGVGRHSPLPVELRHLAYPLALVLAVGGCSLVGSYVHQRPFRLMKTELLSLAVIVGTLLLGWLARK
jgi:hypothetical protein